MGPSNLLFRNGKFLKTNRKNGPCFKFIKESKLAFAMALKQQNEQIQQKDFFTIKEKFGANICRPKGNGTI